jgi:hypothetical protein
MAGLVSYPAIRIAHISNQSPSNQSFTQKSDTVFSDPQGNEHEAGRSTHTNTLQWRQRPYSPECGGGRSGCACACTGRRCAAPHCSNAGLSAKPPAARRAVEVSEGEARLRGRRGRGDVVGPSSPVRRRAAVVCLFPPPPDVSREKELRDWGWLGLVVA